MPNRKSNPRENKLKQDVEDFSKVICLQHDAIVALKKENELFRSDKLELLNRLSDTNRQVTKLEQKLESERMEGRTLRDFREAVRPMIDAYLGLV